MKKLPASVNELFNPKIKTSQDSLNYLPKLDLQISGVGGTSDGADARPRAAALAWPKELWEQLKEILGRFDTALTQDLGALNRAVADAGIPPVPVVTGGQRHRRLEESAAIGDACLWQLQNWPCACRFLINGLVIDHGLHLVPLLG